MKLRLLSLCLGVVLLAGCRKTSFAIEPMVGDIKPVFKTKTHKKKAHFFLFGMVGMKTFDLQEFCPQGAEWFQFQRTFTDVFLGVVTLGIYTPRTLGLKCKPTQGAVQ